MALIVDTGIAYAYYDRRDDWHARSVELLGAEPGELVLPSPVIPEVDHLVGKRLGRDARTTFYSALVEGAYLVADLPRDGYQRALELNEQFADLDLGFVDASVVVIAETLGIRRIATTDRRHFSALQVAFGLELLPA